MEYTFQLLDRNLNSSHPVQNSINYKVRCTVSDSRYGEIADIVVDSVQNENGIFPNQNQLNQISDRNIKKAFLIKLKEFINSLEENDFS